MDETAAHGDPAPRRSQLGTWIGVLVVVAVGLTLVKLVAYLQTPRVGEHHAVGTKFVALDVVPLLGTEQPLSLEDLKGKVTLVNFWKPSCSRCLQELPHLAELHDARADREDFKLLSLILNGSAPINLGPLRKDVSGVLLRRNIEMPVYTDPQGTTQQALAITTGWQGGIPVTIVLDRQGIIRGVWNGYVSGDEKGMAQLVDRLLEE